MKLNRAVLIHALVWVLLIALMSIIVMVAGEASRYDVFVSVCLIGAINILLFYIQYLGISPLFIGDSQYTRAIIYMIVLLFGSVIVKYGIALVFADELLRYGEHKEKMLSASAYMGLAAINSVVFMLASSGVYLTSTNMKTRQQRKSLEKEKLAAELAFLKSQINPHFLFNSLNNIYSLAYKKSDRTAEAILKLAEMMRYMLNGSVGDKVPLQDELDYLQNYIDLQRLRSGDGVYIDMKVNLDRDDYEVMPLLLITFVENAFKHGVFTDEEKPVKILIVAAEGRLHVKVENAKSHDNKDAASGIGLTNLRRRLQLGYPDKHTFDVSDSENYYISELFLYIE